MIRLFHFANLKDHSEEIATHQELVARVTEILGQWNAYHDKYSLQINVHKGSDGPTLGVHVAETIKSVDKFGG